MRTRRNRKRHTPASIMARSKLFQDYQRAFAAASALTLVLGEPDATTLVDWPAGTANPFCTRLAGTLHACASCRAFQSKLGRAATTIGSAQTGQCHAGLCETMVPVRYGKRVFALLQIGQVRLRPATDDNMKRAVQDMAAASRSLKQDVLAAELKATPTFNLTRYDGLVRLLEIFSLQLAEWFVRHRVAETPHPATAVMRVKEWLDSHYHEPITLHDAARAAGVSRWHLSKVFHRDTGMQFREFLVQVRLERARHLLAHDDMKIGEVAAAVGFQSISQFNRTFRKANGQSAGEYRRAFATRQVNRHEAPRPDIPSSLRINGDEATVARVA